MSFNPKQYLVCINLGHYVLSGDPCLPAGLWTDFENFVKQILLLSKKSLVADHLDLVNFGGNTSDAH